VPTVAGGWRPYLRWIDATKRRPEQRPVRIAEMVKLLETGIKQRPYQPMADLDTYPTRTWRTGSGATVPL